MPLVTLRLPGAPLPPQEPAVTTAIVDWGLAQPSAQILNWPGIAEHCLYMSMTLKPERAGERGIHGLSMLRPARFLKPGRSVIGKQRRPLPRPSPAGAFCGAEI